MLLFIFLEYIRDTVLSYLQTVGELSSHFQEYKFLVTYLSDQMELFMVQLNN